MRDLLNRTRKAAASGEFELSKTSAKYDATSRYPRWLGIVQRAPLG